MCTSYVIGGASEVWTFGMFCIVAMDSEVSTSSDLGEYHRYMSE